MAAQIENPQVSSAIHEAVHEPLIEVPPAPADYRHLDTDGYTSYDVAPWAEKRQCMLSGSSCLYAKKAFKAGDVMSEFGPKVVVDTPNYLTVQVGETQHIMLSPEWLQYINHSCDPNVFFDTAAFKLVALRDIAEGDELCFFYPSTEWHMASPFQCRCGTKACIGTIAGASQMTQEQLARYRLTDYIQSKVKPSSP
uniref:SET domain-containing protein n=1 Tax=Chlamydomonas leiostraca TaxID=1034604 RepID=A0A7S0RQ64_9CHLO|mmetsp:Transcript_28717/g.73014  ORF Transcript_28717/g.73014 Transcript_28717/m.73014 type:complete len:196 (+) Transcript_28717:77-664(+)